MGVFWSDCCWGGSYKEVVMCGIDIIVMIGAFIIGGCTGLCIGLLAVLMKVARSKGYHCDGKRVFKQGTKGKGDA